MDSQYVSRTLGRCLSEALAEIIELRPLDPIEFLALWIRKYKHNQELELQRAAHQRELEEEKRRVHEENLHQRELEEEENRIRAAQHVPESADESKPELCEDERESVADPPERASEPKDQLTSALPHQEEQTPEILNTEEEQTSEILNTEEEQTSEILNTEEDLHPEDLRDSQSAGNEADAPEENQPGSEGTEGDSDERRMEKEEDEEDDGA